MRSFKGISRIRVFIKDKNKKSIARIIKEVLVLLVTKKEIPFYYFKFLYRKDVKNYLDYLSTKEVVAIGRSQILHKLEYRPIFNDKLFFALFCEKASINTPKLVSYNLGDNFCFEGKSEKIGSKKELIIFFEKIFSFLNIEALFFDHLRNMAVKVVLN